jgi:hypothetical protein
MQKMFQASLNIHLGGGTLALFWCDHWNDEDSPVTMRGRTSSVPLSAPESVTVAPSRKHFSTDAEYKTSLAN